MSLLAAAILLAASAGMFPARADSSSPLLHAYYDRLIAIVDNKVYAWQEDERPARLPVKDPKQVGTDDTGYLVLTAARVLLRFAQVSARPVIVSRDVTSFSSGRSGLFLIDPAATLWWLPRNATARIEIARDVASAAVGDGANYFVKRNGDLFVRGLAHRGQYGDGRLRPTKIFVRTAKHVAQIRAHTGHAIMLTRDGGVFGTGGNIYGPVGKHGLGDKAVRWSPIASRMKAVATGASHSLAIGAGGNLFAWGAGYGVQPRQIMTRVRAVAAGSRSTIALRLDNTLWHWTGSNQPRMLTLR